MDTSKEYIKMCEKAGEIQKEWDEKLVPSFFYDYALDRVTIRIWVPKSLERQISAPITSQRLIISIEEKRPIDKWIPEGNLAPVVWLPRQDQLQEMYLNNRKHKINCGQMSMFFEDWRVDELMRYGKDLINWSMEQLWLAFVMKEKYGKVWDGKEWRVK